MDGTIGLEAQRGFSHPAPSPVANDAKMTAPDSAGREIGDIRRGAVQKCDGFNKI
jgi:hypothetical protein